jgi:hypothetical protein
LAEVDWSTNDIKEAFCFCDWVIGTLGYTLSPKVYNEICCAREILGIGLELEVDLVLDNIEELCKTLLTLTLKLDDEDEVFTAKTLNEIPNRILKNKEFCYWIMERCACALLYVQEDFITEEICKKIAQKNATALRYIPPAFQTEELCNIAVEAGINYERNQFNISVLQFVPEHLKSEKLCKIEVKNYGPLAFEHVPEHLKTEEFCKFAVEMNEFCFLDIPTHLQTEELCKLALEKNADILEFIPEHLKNKELCKRRFKNETN